MAFPFSNQIIPIHIHLTNLNKMKASIFFFLLVMFKFEGQSQFPYPSCDSLPQYQYLRQKYQKYIGKTIIDFYAEDSLTRQADCYTICSDFEIRTFENGMEFFFHLKKETPYTEKNLLISFLYLPIESIAIKVYDQSKHSEEYGWPIRCLLFIQNENK